MPWMKYGCLQVSGVIRFRPCYVSLMHTAAGSIGPSPLRLAGLRAFGMELRWPGSCICSWPDGSRLGVHLAGFGACG